MGVSQREAYISSILDNIRSGKTREECLSSFVERWRKSSRTFDRYWKIAGDKHSERIHNEEEKKAKDHSRKKISEAKKGLLTAEKKKRILADIAAGIASEGMSKPAYKDRIAALRELNKMDGDLSPKKVDLTTSKEIVIGDASGEED